MKITQEELKNALELHEKWLSNEPGGVRLDLHGVDLRLSDLSNANLKRANLSGADLSGVNLSEANLSDANLRHANLRGADFTFANLSDANLRHANLRGADFTFANLSSADLSHADLSDSDLSWLNTINVIGLDVICIQLNTSDKNRQVQYYVQLNKVTAGCFMGTLDELKKAVDNRHDKDSLIYKRYQIAFKTIEYILDTY